MAGRRSYQTTCFDNLESRLVLSHVGTVATIAAFHHVAPGHGHPVAPIHMRPSHTIVHPPSAPLPVHVTPNPSPAAPQPLSMASMSASQFNTLFQPIPTTPAMSSDFLTPGGKISGVMVSQVFQGTGAASGQYAYAYQIDVQNVAGSNGQAAKLSWKFNGAPSDSYVIRDGPIGDLNAPGQAAPSWLAWSGSTLNVDLGTVHAGDHAATFVVLSSQPPTNQQIVNFPGSNPVNPVSPLTLVYAP